MKLGGGVILWTYIVWVFARWAAEERESSSATRRSPTEAPSIPA
jgi:hypothetical protein